MNRRAFLMSMAAAALPAAPKRPNIILILADDMGFSDLGCYGSEIETPNIDALAQGGMRFTQFYNNARCCPTRASILTGMYPHQAGVGHMMGDYNLPAYRGTLNKNTPTIAEGLRPAGYHTLMTGKWHVTPPDEAHRDNWPMQRGFEHYYGTIMGAGSYYDPASLQRDNQPLRAPANGFYYTTALGENAASMIREYGPKPEPYFLYAAFTAPHWPLHAPEAAVEKYATRYREGWDKLRAERHARQIESGIVERKWPLTPRDESVPAWENEQQKEWQVRRMAVYAAQIDLLDQAVGEIVQAVKQSGKFENTLILFLADNGGCAEDLKPGVKAVFVPPAARDGSPMRPGNDATIKPGPDGTYETYGIGWANASNTPFRLYKHWVHEGGISTPLIAHWPAAIKPGSITNQYGHIIDLMPTCLDAAGTPRKLEGRSLLPILTGGKRTAAPIYWEHEGNRAVREGKWKLVSRFPGTWELYDIEADRTELHDLAAKQPAIATRLRTQWEAWAKRVGVGDWDVLRKQQNNS